MAGIVAYWRWRSSRERRGLRCALVVGVVVNHRHWRWYVSVRRFYACARWLAMCLGWRLFAQAMWRRGLLLHSCALRRVNIATGAAVTGVAQFLVRCRSMCVIRWTCCALVLRWRDDIIGRRHSPVERKPGSQQEVIDYTWVEGRNTRAERAILG
jgi:hypothetical protein